VIVMPLLLPPIRFSRGRILCLHVPHGSHNAVGSLERQLVDVARQQAKGILVCRPATSRRGPRQWLWPQTSVDWLARAASVSRQEAHALIAALPVPVATVLSHNAGTPRSLLGIAAALARETDVVVYTTAGLDPLGCEAVHEYIASRRVDLCVIHLSMPAFYGDGSHAPRLCPSRAECLPLADDAV
jgi:hypothetical protein